MPPSVVGLVLLAACGGACAGVLFRSVFDGRDSLAAALAFGALVSLPAFLHMTRIFGHINGLRLRAEASEQKFRMIFDAAGIGISVGANGMLTETNRAYQELVGYTAAELSAMHYSELTHPDDPDEDGDLMAALAMGEKPSFAVEKRYVRRDGGLVWVRVTVTMAPDGSFGIGLIEDVTERRRLLARTVEVAEAERISLAADLHDGPIQHLTAALLALDLVESKLARSGQAEIAAFAASIRRDIAAEMRTLRRLMIRLRPPVMDERGLEAALRDCAESILADTAIRVRLDSNLGDLRLAPELESAVFRLVRDRLSAVHRQGRARHTEVGLDLREESLVLTMHDDAPPSAVPGWDGTSGTLTLGEHVESLGGSWAVADAEGGGTRIQAVLPRM